MENTRLAEDSCGSSTHVAIVTPGAAELKQLWRDDEHHGGFFLIGMTVDVVFHEVRRTMSQARDISNWDAQACGLIELACDDMQDRLGRDAGVDDGDVARIAVR